MKLIFSFLLRNLLTQNIAYAHCDIPCGIYDPHGAQLAAHTIIRMTELLTEVKKESELKAEHDISRLTHVKESQSNLLEEELTTLENDYFKAEHYKEYPKLGENFSNANKLGAKVRQNIDIDAAEELLEEVMQIAEIFYKTKGVEFVRVKSVYPTQRELVIQK
nr:superoxide dismutase, Ni [Candidatus Levybacteria bacterium]